MSIETRLKFEKVCKWTAIIFMVLTMVNVFMPDLFVVSIEQEELTLDNRPQAFVRWFNAVAFLVIPIIAFFNKPTFKKIAVYFCLPMAIIYLCFFKEIMEFMTSPYGRGIYEIRFMPQAAKDFMINPIFRGGLLIATSLCNITTIILMIIRDPKFLKFKKDEILPFFIILICLIISIIPCYVPQYILGTYTDIILTAFSLPHFCWLIFMVLEIVFLTLIFKDKKYEDKYILLLCLSLTLLIQYNQMFSSLGELTCKRMPFQLCNIGSYLMLITLLTKNERLYQFNLIINVAGGLIAAVMMDVEGKGLFYLWNMHYLVEHNNVIVTPILCMLLNMFRPLRGVDYKYFVRNFTFYWLFILVLGTILNGVKDITGNDYFQVNYLFMFMREATEKIVGFVGPWFDIQIHIGPFTLYPIVQLAVLLGFIAIGSIVFIAFIGLFRKRKILI